MSRYDADIALEEDQAALDEVLKELDRRQQHEGAKLAEMVRLALEREIQRVVHAQADHGHRRWTERVG